MSVFLFTAFFSCISQQYRSAGFSTAAIIPLQVDKFWWNLELWILTKFSAGVIRRVELHINPLLCPHGRANFTS